MRDKIEKMVAEFDADCAKKGHGWASSSIFPGTQYCQSCGATRAVVSMSALGITDKGEG